jgi:hypothetical protein
MRPPAVTLAGVGEPSPFDDVVLPEISSPVSAAALPVVSPPPLQSPPSSSTEAGQGAPTSDASADPEWAPPRAEPGDMGWDIVYGVKRTMSNNVQPRYNFESDDEETSEIQVPPRRRS